MTVTTILHTASSSCLPQDISSYHITDMRQTCVICYNTSVATNANIEKIYKEKGVNIPAGISIDKCFHTSAAWAATGMADESATATATKDIQRRRLLQVAAVFTSKSLRPGNTSASTMRLSTKKSLTRSIRTDPIVISAPWTNLWKAPPLLTFQIKCKYGTPMIILT